MTQIMIPWRSGTDRDPTVESVRLVVIVSGRIDPEKCNKLVGVRISFMQGSIMNATLC